MLTLIINIYYFVLIIDKTKNKLRSIILFWNQININFDISNYKKTTIVIPVIY